MVFGFLKFVGGTPRSSFQRNLGFSADYPVFGRILTVLVRFWIKLVFLKLVNLFKMCQTKSLIFTFTEFLVLQSSGDYYSLHIDPLSLEDQWKNHRIFTLVPL